MTEPEGGSTTQPSQATEPAAAEVAAPASPSQRLDEVLADRQRHHESGGVQAEKSATDLTAAANSPTHSLAAGPAAEPAGFTSPALTAARATYAKSGFFAAGALIAVMVDEERSDDLAGAVRERLATGSSPRLLVLDMRHVISTMAGSWWEQQTASSLPSGSRVIAAHAPAGLTFAAEGAVHHRGTGSALPGISNAYRGVLRSLPRPAA